MKNTIAMHLLTALSNSFGKVNLGPKKLSKLANGKGKSNAAQLKREAKKRNNIRKHK